MWDDGFWFLVSALVTAFYYLWWSHIDQFAKFRMQGCAYGAPSWRRRLAAASLWCNADPVRRRAGILLGCVTLIVTGHVAVSHWHDGEAFRWPHLGIILVIGIGVLFGLFTGAMLTRLRRPKVLKFVWPAALALLGLSVGYSLPVYHQEISDLLRNAGISHFKVSLAAIQLETDMKSHGAGGANSAASGPTGSPAQAVPHPNDPGPALETLFQEFNGDGYDLRKSDQFYIESLWPQQGLEQAVNKVKYVTENITLPIESFAKCLSAFAHIGKDHFGKIKDPQLLRTYTNSMLATLFRLHRYSIEPRKEFQDIAADIAKLKDDGSFAVASIKSEILGQQENQGAPEAFPGFPQGVLPVAFRPVAGGIKLPDCSHPVVSEASVGALAQDLARTPYLTLALADLLMAVGAADEAVDVLAEWLSKPEDAKADRDRVQSWYEIRVISKLAVNLKTITGRSNRVFRTVLARYQELLRTYIKDSRYKRVLDLDEAKCKELAKTATEEANKQTPPRPGAEDIERRLAYLLIDQETEMLNTELGFVPEQTDFEKLDELHTRARKLRELKNDCLPESRGSLKSLELYDDDFRKGTIARGRVVAGAISLAVGERMTAVAGSAGERKRAQDAREEGEKWLRDGWHDLRPLWEKTDPNQKQGDQSWHDRIFSASRWEESATLARRILAQLHQEG